MRLLQHFVAALLQDGCMQGFYSQLAHDHIKRLCTGYPGREWKQPVSFFQHFHEIWWLLGPSFIILHRNYGELPHGTLHLQLKLPGFLIQCLLINIICHEFGITSNISNSKWLISFYCNNSQEHNEFQNFKKQQNMEGIIN